MTDSSFKLVKVSVDTGLKSLDKPFDYLFPKEIKEKLSLGHLVEVPFGRGKKKGIVVGFSNEDSPFTLKEISRIIGDEPVVTEDDIKVAAYMRNIYVAPFCDCLKLMCPPYTFMKEEERVSELKRKYVRLIKSQEEFEKILEKSKSKMQVETARFLLGGPVSLSEICEKPFCSNAVIKALFEKGIVETYFENKRRNPFSGKEIKKSENLVPTEEQKEALKALTLAIDGNESDTFLLHGITGSGKTEVFMQIIDKVIKKGKTAIVLVPEISLTPQMTDRFLGRFGDEIAILHSVLSQGERLDEWNRIKKGEAKVVIGARSAVFAPLKNIGIIIIDEEHENTYRSEQSPRYDAREVAKKRCEMNNAPLLLASATPDIKSYYRAKEGEYKLLKMTKRYNEVNLPDVKVADMRKELKEGNRSMLSRALTEEIRKNLERKEQTVLFLNRRGFSTFVSCRDCGYVASCPQCSIALTYHKAEETLNCHYCGYETKVLKECPECRGHHVKYFGAGTQKLEDEIKKTFPTASIIRMDVDTTTKKGSHEKILDTFSKEKTDILLGTQMVSKGLDFPNISLVGVIAADMSLNIDDYRASERTFDLITQVSGRAGRGEKKGRAIIQTYNPENQVINMAKDQDYEAFYESEIAYRKFFGYPPFMDIVSFVFSSENELLAKSVCEETEKMAEEMLSGIEYTKYSTMPCPVSKIKGNYRYRFWIKSKVNDELRKRLFEISLEKKHKDVRFTLEINPGSML